MKTAFIVQPSSDFAANVAFAQREGIDGVEIMFQQPTASDFADVEERERILGDHDTAVSAIGLWGLGLADPASSGSADIIKRGMDFAAELDASCFFTGAGDPEGDDPVAALATCYDSWAQEADWRGLRLAVYLGHKGSFIFSEQALADACQRIPHLGLKLDPVGIIRNLKADPLHVLYAHGRKLVYFHVKGLLRLPAGELEPPAGLDGLPWKEMFGILHQYGYDGYVSAEPHGRFWGKPDERRQEYVRLTFRNLAPLMGK